MSQRLFTASKVACFVDTYSPGVEKRRGEVVGVLTVKLRVQPFDAKLASSLDDGVGGDSNIRPTVFSLNTTEPKPCFTRHDFKLGLGRQNLEIFASTDTAEARIALLQAKLSGCYVRTQKDVNALALIFKATWGPVGRDELELIHSLHRSQAFVTFHEAEPLLGLEDDGEGDDELTDADEKARRPAPMWDDEGNVGQSLAVPAEPIAAADDSQAEPARKPIRRHADRTTAATVQRKARGRR